MHSKNGKELEEINKAYNIFSMYELLSCSKVSDVLSFGFRRDIATRGREMPNKITSHGNFHVRKYLKNIFGFAGRQEKATKGLIYELTLERKGDNHVFSHADRTDAENNSLARRVIIGDFIWYNINQI